MNNSQKADTKKQACGLFSKVASEFPVLGDFLAAIIDNTCMISERGEGYKMMRAVCFKLGAKPNDDAPKNSELRTALEALAELYQSSGNQTQISFFKFTYLYSATSNEWYPFKWKKVPEAAL